MVTMCQRFLKSTEARALLPHTHSLGGNLHLNQQLPQLAVQTVTPWASTFPSAKGVAPSPQSHVDDQGMPRGTEHNCPLRKVLWAA